MPKWIPPAVIVLIAVSLVPAALIKRARSTHSPVPRINIIPDMDSQPSFRAQSANGMFADGRGMRAPVEGTVARGMLEADDHFHRGIVADDWADQIPEDAGVDLAERGRERYGIYCTPCHGAQGNGDGPVALRADKLAEGTWTPPTSLHDSLVRDRPEGHIFNTITRGIRSMPSYGVQIPAADRWAIVAHVRALQAEGQESIR